jgi:FtsP/CotA-like multicopper oxidase with cupredoxin domain
MPFHPARRHFLRSTALLGWPLLGAAFTSTRARAQELPALDEIALDRSEPGLAIGRVTAEPALVAVNGTPTRVLAYNRSWPGPLLRVRQGETVRLRFANRLEEDTNLHFHGMNIPPTGRADNIWIHVPPGGEFEHEFAVSRHDAGLHWYHPHVHGRMARQMFAGLTGAILIEDPPHIAQALRAADDRLLVLKDITVERGGVQPHRHLEWPVGKEGELLLVNGVSRPVITARSALVRLRLLNASNARYWRLRLDGGRAFHLAAEDGRFLERPVAVEELLLVPGARCEALVDVSDGEPAVVTYHPSARSGHAFTAVQTLFTIEPPATPGTAFIPERLGTIPVFDRADVAQRRTLLLSLLNICGQFYREGRIDIHAQAGTRELWEVQNVDLMDHTFHLHTWHFQVLAVNGQEPAFRAMRDTVNLRPGDRLLLGVHFEEHAGRTLYHCHMTEHSDKGMMAVIQVA